MANASPPGTQRLIGRRAELAALDEALTKASAGHLRIVLLSGLAGMGKSTVIRRYADRARHQGARVIVAECAAEDAMRPLAPLAAAYDDFASVIDLTAGRGSPLDAPERYRVFRPVVEGLRGMARDRAVLLVIEDIHWADEDTLHLVPYLSRRAAGAALLVVLTYRREAALAMPLADALTELQSRGAIALRLGPLTQIEVAQVVASALGSTERPDAELRSFIAERSGGTPLFVEELSRALLEGGWLRREGGFWRSARPLVDAVLPTSVDGTVRARLALMTADARKALATAAVLGQRFSLGRLCAVTGLSTQRAVEVLRAALDANLIEEGGEVGECSFRHASLRDAVLTGMLAAERRRLHRAVAVAIERETPEPARASVAAELADHFDAGGDTERGLHYHLMALRRSSDGTGIGDLVPALRTRSAAHHLARALALAPPDHPARAEILRAHAWAQDDPARRLPLIEESLAQATRAGDERGVALSTLMAGVWRGLQSDRTGLPTIREAIRLLETTGSGRDRAEARSQLARIAMLAGDADAIAVAEDALRLAREQDIPALEAHELITLGTAHISAGRTDGIELLRAGVALARAHSAGPAEMRGLGNLWLCLVGSGAADEETREIEAALAREVARTGMADRTFDIQLLALFMDDRWDAALALIEEMSFPPFNGSAIAAMIRGYVAVARAGPDGLLAAVSRTHDEVTTRFGSQPMALAPEIYHLAGDLPAALVSAPYVARAFGGRMTREFVNTAAVAILAAAVAVGDEASIERWLDLCARRHDIEAATAAGRRAFAEGERALREGRREDALDAFARSAAGFQLRGSTLLARTLPRVRRAEILAPTDVVAAQKELSTVMGMWRAVGATWYLGRLRAWADAHGLRGWTVSARRGPRLTPRELEVARRVAEGLTNKEIAGALGITERTAETHVQRILTKLDLRGRAQLAAWVVGAATART